MAETKLIKMRRDSDGLLADVHPAEVENFKAGGFAYIQEEVKPQNSEKPRSKTSKAEIEAVDK